MLAGSYQQFDNWCRERGLSPRNPHVVYVERWDRLRGRARLKIERVGTYLDRRDWDQVLESVRVLEAHGKLVLDGDSVCVHCGEEITRPGSGWWRATGDDTLICRENRTGLHEAPAPVDA